MLAGYIVWCVPCPARRAAKMGLWACCLRNRLLSRSRHAGDVDRFTESMNFSDNFME